MLNKARDRRQLAKPAPVEDETTYIAMADQNAGVGERKWTR